MDERKPVDEHGHIIAVVVLRAVVFGDYVLIGDLQTVVVNVLFVNQRDIFRTSVIAPQNLHIILLHFAGLFRNAVIGIGNALGKEPLPFAVGKAVVVQRFQLCAQVGDQLRLAMNRLVLIALLCQKADIRTHGVLSPILVRPTEDGEYEIVSGHRRVFACRRLGIKEVPAIAQPMTQEEAVLKMVDSNLHRERLLPSEKAFAYKMKLDAIKHRGKSLSQVATKSDSAAEVGAAMGESRDMVFRYIRLTNLVPSLLDMVDEGKIALMPAERLSYLTEEEQLALVDIMEDLEVTPSLSQAVKLKDLSASHRLNPDSMYEVMEKPKANQRETVKLDADTLRRFFPDYTPKQMETAILRMLEEAERERQRQKILRRSRDDAR